MADHPSFRYLIREGFIVIKQLPPKKQVKKQDSENWDEDSGPKAVGFSIMSTPPYRVVANKQEAQLTLMANNEKLETLPFQEVLDIANIHPFEDGESDEKWL